MTHEGHLRPNVVRLTSIRQFVLIRGFHLLPQSNATAVRHQRPQAQPIERVRLSSSSRLRDLDRSVYPSGSRPPCSVAPSAIVATRSTSNGLLTPGPRFRTTAEGRWTRGQPSDAARACQPPGTCGFSGGPSLIRMKSRGVSGRWSRHRSTTSGPNRRRRSGRVRSVDRVPSRAVGT